MQNKKLGSKLVSLLAGLIYVVFGFLMIQNPNTALTAISLIMGWFVAGVGIAAFIYTVTYKGDPDQKKISSMEGFLLLMLGLMLLFGNFINSTLILSYLLIFWIIIDSALQLQLAALIIKPSLRIVVMIMDILIISFGVFMLFNPGLAENFLVFYIGFGFVSTGIAKFIKSM